MCIDFTRLNLHKKSTAMKNRTLLPLAALSAILASCASQGGGEDYDVSNPYAAPDYGDEAGTPYAGSDVNPAYDAPAVYEDTTPVADPTPAPAPAPAASATMHTVARGDSLWKISRKYGVTVDAIKQANGLTNDTAVLGAKLSIPAR
jgi:LysM repeat protein